MKNFKMGFILALFLFLPSLIVEASNTESLAFKNPNEVIVEALTEDSKPALGTKVLIRLISAQEPVEVYNGEVNHEGKVIFNPYIAIKANYKLLESDGPIQDYIYEITYISPQGETKYEYLTISEFKPGQSPSLEELKELKQTEKKNIIVNFTGSSEHNIYNSKNTLENDIIAFSTRPSSGCTYIGDTVYQCLISSYVKTVDTKVGSVNVASGETAQFKLTSSAKNIISAGSKTGTGGWGLGTGVSISTMNTNAVNRTIPGTCLGYASTWRCSLTHGIFASVNFRYEHIQYWDGNKMISELHKIIPVGLQGGSTKTEIVYNSSNDKNATDALNGLHGLRFAVDKYNSSTFSYSRETTYTAAFTFESSIGSFTGNVTTAYASSNEIIFSTTGNDTFVHYDNQTGGQMFYVTKK